MQDMEDYGWEVLQNGENQNYNEEVFLQNKWSQIQNAETWG